MSEMLVRDHDRLVKYQRTAPLSDGRPAYIIACPMCHRDVGGGISPSTGTSQLWAHVCVRNADTVERYELYKEAAEKWARDCVNDQNGWCYDHEHCCWKCMDCYAPLDPCDKSPAVHAADCKAARILNLKREGA